MPEHLVLLGLGAILAFLAYAIPRRQLRRRRRLLRWLRKAKNHLLLI